ncbi:MAG: hypothetical protein AB7Q16_18495 [Vicinamibacterales bacterium]
MTTPPSGAGRALPAAVRLTAGQRVRLLLECAPLVASIAAFAAFELLLAGVLREQRLIVRGLLGVFVIAAIVQARNRLRDLASGVALVAEDRVERMFGDRHHYVEFERLGRFRLIGQAHVSAMRGSRYRVYYSQASKVAWRLEGLKY